MGAHQELAVLFLEAVQAAGRIFGKVLTGVGRR